jgi:ribosome-binding factor A
MSIRTEKVAGEVQKALARPLQKLASEISAGFITANHVRMSPDLRIAKVYVGIFGGKITPQQAMISLELRTKDIRREVVSHLRLRFAPELKFYLDDTLDMMEKVDALLKRTPKPAPLPDSAPDNTDAPKS